ncbi:interleukin-17 receptor A isoform X1 [Thunnus albacares]|uniref:interleukin-17 receptor A isoform X1 n=2 Tax=Thunnus albacares TaxID=8236 RepID=UPI001CF6F274|nr:interleukin-17 receptor A isoform X1 [Thunnus albacares]
MIHVPFLCFLYLTAGLTVSSSLWILDKRLDCSQLGLDHCKINNCSDKHMVEPAHLAPTGPEWGSEHVGVGMDKHRPVPIVNVTWTIRSDASVLKLRGSEINILDESTNQSICVQFSYNIRQQLNPNDKKWTFSLDGVVVEPRHSYMVTVFNLPEPEIERDQVRIRKQIIIPGCDDQRIQKAQMCLENGSLWDPHITRSVSVDEEHKMLSIVVGFEAAKYSEKYQVSIQGHGFHCSNNVSKENTTSQNVTFELGLSQLLQCKMVIMIRPFFIRCKNDCERPEKTFHYCPYYPTRTLLIKASVGLVLFGICLAYWLWSSSHKDPVNTSTSAAKEQPECFQVQDRKRVLVIYSLDHPLYKIVVLKLCAFLATTCGTEVVLDLLDSTRLGMLGSIQWLDWHREQIESSSDKILILCSRGVQAKWRAMCGDKKVFLREDVRSPIGDMLTPALSLMVPHFVRSASFKKYIVAYFDDICSEEDVPSPFNITVRYKLMEQFEELFFRILDIEKHEPGRVNHIGGLAEDEYHHCPSGRALRDSIEAFQAYQLEHPQWFEEELLENSELEVEETSAEIYQDAKTTMNPITYCEPDSTQVISHVKTQESDFTVDKIQLYMAERLQMSTSLQFNPHIVEDMQPVLGKYQVQFDDICELDKNIG